MSTEHTLLNLMTDGGWVMWALLALSLASLAVALERSWVLHRARNPVADLAAALRRTLGTAGSPTAAPTRLAPPPARCLSCDGSGGFVPTACRRAPPRGRCSEQSGRPLSWHHSAENRGQPGFEMRL